MTKKELMERYNKILDGIGFYSKKSEIETAINCLECPDKTMDKHLEMVRTSWAAIANAAENNGDFKRHSHNRLFIFTLATIQ